MRIVFMGTPQFAATILEELTQHHDVIAVYTRPDAVRSRGKTCAASPVKQCALERDIPVYTPSSLRTPEAQTELRALSPDVICVAAYGMILPREVLDIPPYGCLNVHASLLPRWRGAAPVERAIMAGDDTVGVCIMQMEEGLDTGDFCVSRTISVDGRSAAELTHELAELGACALLTALEHVTAGCAQWVAQDEANVTYADKISKGELHLDPALSAQNNVRLVQASSETHPARCEIAGRGVSVQSAQVVTLINDSLVSDTGENLVPQLTDIPQLDVGQAQFIRKHLYLGCSEGVLEVLTLKPDGKREMDAASFAAGLPILREGSAKWASL